MSKVILLEQLREFTQETVKDILLPVRATEEEPEPAPRPARVFLTRLPEVSDATDKAPYILHQVITGRDAVQEGRPLTEATAVVRTVFCVYHENGEQGGLSLLTLMEQLRIALLKFAAIGGGQFSLDVKEGLESLVYPSDSEDPTAPYYLGEMMSTWHIPPVNRLDTTRVIHGMPPWDPKARHLQETFTLKGSDQNG